MKKLLLFLSIVCSIAVFSQTITTNPAVITDDYAGEITITYDPAVGSMSTATSCYAHIGVTVADVPWQCSPTWRSALAKHKLVKDGAKWVLTIDNLKTYFSPCTGTYQAVSMVFNDGASGTKEGKNASGGDFIVAVSPAGVLDVKFSQASSSGVVALNGTVNFTINATSSANLVIKKNGVSVKSATGVTTLTYSETISAVGDFTFTGEATSNGKTATDTRSVAVISGSESQTRPLGLREGITYNTLDATKAHLCLFAKDRLNVLPDNVFVTGDFNNWAISNNYQLKKEGDTGYWWIELTGLESGKEYAFQYVVKVGSKTIKISDPYSEKVLHSNDQWEPSAQYPNLKAFPAQGDGYVSVLQTNKPSYTWSSETTNFKKPSRNNLVIYEMWVYDFSPERNFKSIIDRLDYIQNLGVNAIQLMPITEYEGNISWGYNPTHYFAVDKSYGTENDLKKLIDECHKRGIAVILDMVFNHVTGAAPQAKLYWGTNGIATNNPFFNQIAPHGASVNQDYDHNNPQVRDMFKRVLKYWIDEFKVDGYRMDISHGFCGVDCGNRSDIVFDYYNNGVKAGHDQAYFILEHWEGSLAERQNYADWGMNVHLNNTHSYEQTAMGWLHEGDGLDASNVDGWLTYCESHDEERNMFKARSFGNGATIKTKPGFTARSPLNTAFNVLLNGSHMMWMFQELGYDYSIFSDAEGAKGNRIDPKPIPESLGWYTDADRMASYQKIGQIIQLRTRILPTVFEGDPTSTDLGSGKAARSIIWGTGGDRIFVVGNFNAPTDGMTFTGPVTITLPSGNDWYDYLANDATVLLPNTSIVLQPGELKIFTAARHILPDVPSVYQDFSLSTITYEKSKGYCYAYPTLADDHVTIETDKTIYNIQVLHMSGQNFTLPVDQNKVDVSTLKAGLYLLHISFNNGQTKTIKFIKK